MYASMVTPPKERVRLETSGAMHREIDTIGRVKVASVPELLFSGGALSRIS